MSADSYLFFSGAQSPLPPAPSREEILSAAWWFQGLTVTTQQCGTLPWFDVALASLMNRADREAVYAAHRAVGSRCIGLAVSWAYYEDGQPYADIPGMDFTANYAPMTDLMREAVAAGFYIYLFCAGDGQSQNGDPGFGEYNDPVGHTYGFQWLMIHLGEIVAAVQGAGLLPYTVFIPGFDSVFYGWSPDQVAAFGALFRQLAPAGFLAIEHDTGHIPIGNGPADYAGGPMQAYDAILSEFDTLHEDSCWQVAARLLGPAYVRPADQPTGDDPHAPFYLQAGTSRGPYVTRGFEFDLYRWVRSQVSLAELESERAYLRALGYAVTG